MVCAFWQSLLITVTAPSVRRLRADVGCVHAWLQVQEGAELKASDLVRFVLQTDTRSKERQAARIIRLKVAPPHPHKHIFICTALQTTVVLSVTYEIEHAWLYSLDCSCQDIHIQRKCHDDVATARVARNHVEIS